MKKTMVVASLIAVCGGSVSVRALDNINPMLGSDTLENFTLRVIDGTICPAAVGLVYTGGGSGGAEMAMVETSTGLLQPMTKAQTVAPMSRFLQTAACFAADATKAEGIAFAADGLGIAVSKAHQACDANTTTGSDCSAQPTTGLRNAGALNGGAYTLGAGDPVNVQGWRDVLRLVFLGLPGTAGKDPSGTTTAGQALRNCASNERKDLVNNYGNLFQDANCGTGGCTQLTHAWRRDLLSGTTDVFRELINAKLYPFCNVRFNTDAPSTDYGTVLSTGAPVFEDPYQDFDPIRRTCVGGGNGQGGSLPLPINGGTTQPDFPASVAEQVCGPRGTLGVVLPIRSPQVGPAIQQFLSKPCLRGAFNLGPAPKLPGSATKDTLCPNGDVPLGNVKTDYVAATGVVNNSSGICLIPAADDGDSQCINGKNNLPITIDPPNTALVANDGRVYNLHMYGAGQTPQYRKDTELGAVARPVVGLFTRIHTTRTLIASAPTCSGNGLTQPCCNHTDATDQIGCLVEADQCSLGFAGGSALQVLLQTPSSPEQNIGTSINGVRNAQACVVSAAYPLSRKVYINTVVGFENVTGRELALAKCFAGGITGGATTFNALLAAYSLFPLPTGPVCQDFRNESCDTPTAASNACANNPVGIPQ